MRIIEPQPSRSVKPMATPPSNYSNFKLIASIVITLFIGSAAIFYIYTRGQTKPVVSSVSDNSFVETAAKGDDEDSLSRDESVSLRLFTDNEFKVFYDNLLLPNLTRVENPPFITGNDLADARLRLLAEQRGYRLRSSPTKSLELTEGQQLQPSALDAWADLRAAAQSANIPLLLTSGYRSVNEQRELFLQRIFSAGATVQSIVNGESDEQINFVLKTTSLPGYSKHHTGYTLDFACSGYAFENFKNSPCYEWLSASNYKRAKVHGFIPSYPPSADAQGPDPEAWEFVWAGNERLYE